MSQAYVRSNVSEFYDLKAIIGFAFFLLFLAGIAFVMLQGRQMVQLGAAGGGAELTGVKWRPVTVGEDAIHQ